MDRSKEIQDLARYLACGGTAVPGDQIKGQASSEDILRFLQVSIDHLAGGSRSRSKG